MRLLDNYTLLGFERDAAGKMAKACLLALVLFCSAVLPTASALHVGSVPCGGIVPIDSQFLLDPLWTISPYMNRVLQESNNTLTITRVDSFSKELKTIIRSESGMEPDSVVVFTLGAGNAVESGTACSVELSPLAAAADGVTATAGRIVLLRTDSSCPMPLQVNLTSELMSVTSHLSTSSAGVQVIPPSLSFSTNTVQFPLTVDFPSSCQIQILLLLNKEGSIEWWYTWIPATVYSAAVTALILPTLFLGKRLHPTVTALLLAVLYVGFLGACIGLIVHLEQWQSTLGRMFPFPRAVTLYCCLPLLYVAYMVILLLRCGRHKSTLFIGLLRLLVYGVNCALCVGYWIAGYVLLGSLSVFQYFATNVVLTLYFVYLVVKFNRPPRKVRETGVVQGGGLRQIRIPTSLSVLWFTPLTPFASCFLFYLDLYLLSGSVASSDGGLRIEDLVRIYNLQLSIPLLFFQNIYGIALLATATAYHMPFVVVLFPSLFLWGLHLIYSVEQYVNEWRRWRERGVGVAAAAGGVSREEGQFEYLTRKGDGFAR
ncbi:hypothetical protein AGDE_06660 [Angomonas deanei]|nr:hypothetical protein AGDE_06660 [Angomonas deanei]|eukprot:EPY36951.1 hypothetical protein AGDE_06660 [Angomonas deanei]